MWRMPLYCLFLALVPDSCVRLVSLPMWTHLPDAMRAELVEKHPGIKKKWQYLQKLEKKQARKKSKNDLPFYFYEKHLVHVLVQDFVSTLLAIPVEKAADCTIPFASRLWFLTAD